MFVLIGIASYRHNRSEEDLPLSPVTDKKVSKVALTTKLVVPTLFHCLKLVVSLKETGGFIE